MSEQETTPQEIWKTIPEAPDFSISNLGRLRRDIAGKRSKSGPVGTWTNKDGYAIAHLYLSGKRLTRYIHSLVAEAFLEPDPLRPTVNHKHGTVAGHGVENLEWATYGENNQHGYDVMGHKAPCGQDHFRAGLTNEQVVEIRKRLTDGETAVSIAADFGVGSRAIGYIKNRQTWRHIT